MPICWRCHALTKHTNICKSCSVSLGKVPRTRQQEKEVCQLYKDGKSIRTTSHLTGFSRKVVTNILKHYKTTFRSHPKSCRRYHCNHSFFADINSETAAYWAGFIAADGCVGWPKENCISMVLAKRDKDHLTKMTMALDSDYPVHIYIDKRNLPHARLVISSLQMVKDLGKLGIGRGKTRHLEFPNLPTKTQHHFVRGFFDGDGWIYHANCHGSKQLSLGIVGLPTFLKPLQDVLVRECQLSTLPLYPTKSFVKVLKYTGNKQVHRILDYLYKDATAYLDRKAKYHLTRNN